MKILNKDMQIDLRLFPVKKSSAGSSEYLRQSLEADGFLVNSEEKIAPKCNLKNLAEELNPDLFILDQSLVSSCLQRRRLKMKKWVKENVDIPLLIL